MPAGCTFLRLVCGELHGRVERDAAAGRGDVHAAAAEQELTAVQREATVEEDEFPHGKGSAEIGIIGGGERGDDDLFVRLRTAAGDPVRGVRPVD